MPTGKLYPCLLAAFLLLATAACTVSNDDEDPDPGFVVPALTLDNSIQFVVDYNSRSTLLVPAKGRLAIDWGDGQVEKIIEPETLVAGIKHTYSKLGKYRVKIWTGEATYLGLHAILLPVSDLTIGDCPKMKDLTIQGMHGLKKFDGARCPGISTLNIGNMSTLTSIDLSQCTELVDLTCFTFDSVTSLDLRQNKRLRSLELNGLELTELKLQENDQLGTIEIYHSPLADVDWEQVPNLSSLMLYNNKFHSLRLNSLSYLHTLKCYVNELTSLDVSALASLRTLDCSQNKLEEVLLNGEAYLSSVSLHTNKLGAEALNAVFTLLRPSSEVQSRPGVPCPIWIYGNPGTATCDKTIFVDKGWVVQEAK